MLRRVALALLVVVGVGSIPGWAKEKAGDLKDECRAVALLLFDATAKKITVVPQRIEMTYPQPGELAREICFTWVISNIPSGGASNFETLDLEGHDNTKGKKKDGTAGELALLKKKKLHDKNSDNQFISLDSELNALPNWDPDGDGQASDIRLNYKVKGKYKVGSIESDIIFDPEIIIKKGG